MADNKTIEIIIDAVTVGLKKGVDEAVAKIKEIEVAAEKAGKTTSTAMENAGKTIETATVPAAGRAAGALLGLINPANLAVTALTTLGAAFIAYVTRSQESVRSLDEVLKDHEDVIKRIGLAYPEAIQGLQQFARESDNVAQAMGIANLQALQDQINKTTQDFINSIAQTTPAAKSLVELLLQQFGAMNNTVLNVNKNFIPFREAIVALDQSVRSGNPNIAQFRQTISDLIIQFKDDKDLVKYGEEILRLSNNASNAVQKLNGMAEAMRRSGAAAREFAEGQQSFADLSRTIDSISPAKVDAVAQAQTRLNEAIAKGNIEENQSMLLFGKLMDAKKRQAEADALRNKPAGAAPVDDGITAQMERRFQFIKDSTLTEEGLLIARYERNRALAQEYFALEMAESGLQGEQRAALKAEQDATIEALDAKHQQNLQRMRAATDAVMMNNLASTFGNIGSIIESGGKRGTAAAKAMYIAQALMSTFSAATQAMANPLLIDPVSKFAAYAAVATKGLAAVASIAKAGGGGGGGGASAGAGAAAGGGGGGSGGGGMGNSVYVNLQGQSFGRDQVRSLVESIAQYQKDGGQVIFA
jgi:hypothetical protein